MMPPRYMRKERPANPVINCGGDLNVSAPRGAHDVAMYKDAACTELVVRWHWYNERKPDKRYRRVMLNCYRWPVVWLEDQPLAS